MPSDSAWSLIVYQADAWFGQSKTRYTPSPQYRKYHLPEMSQAKAVQSAWKIIPHLRSEDIQVSVDFYSGVLGFTIGGVHGKGEDNKPTFCSVYAGDKAAANIYLAKPGGVNSPSNWGISSVWIALGTEQLDELVQGSSRLVKK